MDPVDGTVEQRRSTYPGGGASFSGDGPETTVYAQQDGVSADRAYAASREARSEVGASDESRVQRVKPKKRFLDRRVTLVLGAIAFFLVGTLSGVGLNIAVGEAGGGAQSSQMQGGPSGGQMPQGGGSGGSATGSSGSGATQGAGLGSGNG